jgi:hypothetical protein
MHFKGAAARWIESLVNPDRIPWPNFCKSLHDRFGCDKHDHLLCQMFHIHQTTSVTDYVECFSTLFDHFKAYEPNPDLHYYTTRFVDGLRADIRAIVTMQRPSILDTAYSLALLQEEVGDSVKTNEFHATNHGSSFKLQLRNAMPLPRPPLPPPQATVEKPVDLKTPQVSEDKMSALRSYRHARGLCDFCAEKWFHGHKCAPTIPLHAMQEVWDLF